MHSNDTPPAYFLLWGISASGNTPALHAGMKGSIPLFSTNFLGYIMNIFVTSTDPLICAINLDDKRVGKLGLEGVQILCAVLAARGLETPYKITHVNHPVVKWSKLNSVNASWVVRYSSALFDEFEFRRDKKHKSSFALDSIRHHFSDDTSIPDEFCNCARNKTYNLDFTHLPVEEAYQKYLKERWKTDTRKVSFTKRNLPVF